MPGCGCSGNCGGSVNKDTNCCGEGEFHFTSEIKFDGSKFVCGTDVYAKECDGLNDILAKMFAKICGLNREVLYAVDALSAAAGSAVGAVLPNTSYTVPVNGSGTFEVWYEVNGDLPLAPGAPFAELQINVFRNVTEVSVAARRIVKNESTSDNQKTTISLLVSNIVCADGDVISVVGQRLGGATFSNGVIKIIKKAI